MMFCEAGSFAIGVGRHSHVVSHVVETSFSTDMQTRPHAVMQCTMCAVVATDISSSRPVPPHTQSTYMTILIHAGCICWQGCPSDSRIHKSAPQHLGARGSAAAKARKCWFLWEFTGFHEPWKQSCTPRFGHAQISTSKAARCKEQICCLVLHPPSRVGMGGAIDCHHCFTAALAPFCLNQNVVRKASSCAHLFMVVGCW